jgi:hypothetical protein
VGHWLVLCDPENRELLEGRNSAFDDLQTALLHEGPRIASRGKMPEAFGDTVNTRVDMGFEYAIVKNAAVKLLDRMALCIHSGSNISDFASDYKRQSSSLSLLRIFRQIITLHGFAPDEYC